MGKKNKNKTNILINVNNVNTSNNDINNSLIKEKKPFVSICTPTFNRRPFIPYMIKCFQHQDYPKEQMEWIIIDDGTDKIEDLVKDIPEVKYFSYDTKMPLGEKRNIIHEKSKGSILVYMDDDDYYPPERVSHAVQRLNDTPSSLCAGSSEIYIYYKHIAKMYQFGPYGPNHATAGTFAFKRELLDNHHYENTASLAEEKFFLKNYTVPFVQLDPLKTILVFSHQQNTFDKKILLQEDKMNPEVTKESTKTIDMFIKNPDMIDFYKNRIVGLLKKYQPGNPNMKPDVIKQMKEIDEKRKKEQEQRPLFMMTDKNGNSNPLSPQELLNILNQEQAKNNNLIQQLKGKDEEIQLLQTMLQKTPNNENNENKQNHLVIEDNNGNKKIATNDEILIIIKSQQTQINLLNSQIKERDEKIQSLENLK